MSVQTLKIQTTFRLGDALTDCPPLRISFCSTVDTWVHFTLDGTSGLLYDVEGLSSETVIPNWYTNTPFTDWRIALASRPVKRYVELHQSTIVNNQWGESAPNVPRASTVCTQLTPQVVCALWTGKFGYTIVS